MFYASRLGRPSLRPGRYFRLLFIGYFEGLSSERGIAWRVADSLSLRAFLDLDVTEATPNHSTLSRTRRLGPLTALWGRLTASWGLPMDASGAGRLNRSSPSCLNRSAQRIDFFYGLLSDELPGAPAFAERERLQCGRPRHRRELDRFLAFTHGVVVPDLRRGGGGDAATAVEVLAGPPSGADGASPPVGPAGGGVRLSCPPSVCTP